MQRAGQDPAASRWSSCAVLAASSAVRGAGRRLTEPLPGARRRRRRVRRRTRGAQGEKVYPRPGRRSASQRRHPRGAGRPDHADLLEDAGFVEGEHGNAPDDAEVAGVEIWTERPENPAVQLVAQPVRRGRRGRPPRRRPRPGVDVVVGDEFDGRWSTGRAVGRRQASDVADLQPAGPSRAPVSAARLVEPLREPAAARRPARSRSSVARASLRGVTTSRSSPWRRTVRRSGTSVSPSRITSDTEAPAGSRSSPTSTPCILRDRADRHLQQVGRDPLQRRRLDLEAARLGAPGHRSTRATSGSVGPVSRV